MIRGSKFVAALAVVAALALVSAQANAASVVFTVDSSQSTLSLIVGALGGSATGGVLTTLAGSINADITCLMSPDTWVDSLDLNGSIILLTNGSLSISLGFLGAVEASTFGLGADIQSGVIAGTHVPVGMSTFDPGGAQLTLNTGIITYKGTGAVGGILGSGTFDFVDDPTGVTLPSAPNSVKLTIDQAPGPKGITMLVPFNVTTTITTDPVDITATLTGQIVATAIKIPEPGTLTLMALAICGLVPVIRRRLRG